MNYNGRIIALHTTSVHPWEKPFIIGAVVYENGVEIDHFIGRRPLTNNNIHKFDKETIRDSLKGIRIDYTTYKYMSKAFARWLLEVRDHTTIILVNDLSAFGRNFPLTDMYQSYDMEFYESFEPIYDVQSILFARKFSPSIYVYNHNHKIYVPSDDAGGASNPLYTCRAMALCYMHIMGDTFSGQK